MSEECNHDCNSCAEECSDRTQEPYDFRAKPNAGSKVKKVIAVVSGKGGVGKSLVTSMMAVAMGKKGYKTAILDADVTGPSIPRAFGLTQKATGDGVNIYPVQSKGKTSVMSVNLLLENDTDPVVWRGPVIAGTVKQFWTDVVWGDVDYMFVDMPPGTGDVPLTVFQSLPIDGIIVVTSPQELVSMIVEKAVNMAGMMNVPVLALVENMSYFKCPDCGKIHAIFGESHIDEIAAKYNIQTVCRLPINPELARATDAGRIEEVEQEGLNPAVEMLLHTLSADAQKDEVKSMKIAVTYDNGEIFQHFGHTEQFKVYTVEEGKVVSSEVVGTNGTGHEALAVLLQRGGIDTLICGGIGGGAQTALAAQGIRLYGGVTGSADQAVEDFLAGRLDYNPDVMCDHHDHEGSCDGHGEGSCGHHCQEQ